MEISSIANKLACSGVGGANTGKLGCLSLFGTPTHLLALTRGYQIPGSTEFNVEYIKEEVQKGNIIPIIDASAFEDVSAEDAYSTNTSGIKRLNLKGLPEYRLTFEEGHEFYRELAKMESFKSYNFIIGDDEGNWMLVKRSNGNFSGFTAGHVTPELTRRKVKGGDAEAKALLIQFLDRLEWDRNYAILHAEELGGLMPSDIPSVNGVSIDYNALPADADVALDVTVTLASDRNTLIEGLEADDFKLTADGADVAVSAVTESTPGVYSLTVTALTAGEELVLELYDSAINAHVADSNDVLYRGSVTAEVITA